MPEFTFQTAAIAATIAAGIMTVGFAARSTRWGTPLLMAGILSLLAIIGFGIIDMANY